MGLAARPTEEWLRSFDTSCWVEDPSRGENSPDVCTMAALVCSAVRGSLGEILENRGKAALISMIKRLADDAELSHDGCSSMTADEVDIRMWVIDGFTHPKSGRQALTWRTELRSTTRLISKEDMSDWQKQVRAALTVWS